MSPFLAVLFVAAMIANFYFFRLILYVCMYSIYSNTVWI